MTLEPLSALLPAVVTQLAHYNPGRTPMTEQRDRVQESINRLFHNLPTECELDLDVVQAEVDRLRAALVTESGHVDRLVAANKGAADEVERLRNLVAERDAAVGRVRSRCDAIHTASREWDVSARPGGLLRCCEVSDLLDGREDQS